MSENQSYEPQPASQPDQPVEWREPVREAQPEKHGSGAWMWGVFLILLGIIFLLDNTNLLHLQNWWALFILLPAMGSFQGAYQAYRNAGNRLTAGVRGSLFGGFLITFVALIFLFGMNFGLLWPVLLLVAGVGLLINAIVK